MSPMAKLSELLLAVIVSASYCGSSVVQAAQNNVLSVNIKKTGTTTTTTRTRTTASRLLVNARDNDNDNNVPVGDLGSNNNGYYAQIMVGTPAQPIDLLLDTGSSQFWLVGTNSEACSSSSSDDCTSPFDASASSSFRNLTTDSFNVKYLDGDWTQGNYFRDSVSIGSGTSGGDSSNVLRDAQMGLANGGNISYGILGLGFPAADWSGTGLLDMLKKQGLIEVRAYGIDLNTDNGTIVFGGIDTSKYDEASSPLTSITAGVPVGVDPNSFSPFAVRLSSLKANYTAINGTTQDFMSDSSSGAMVILDTGTERTYLPSSVVSAVYDAFGVVLSDDGQIGYVDCKYRSSSSSSSKENTITLDFFLNDDINAKVKSRRRSTTTTTTTTTTKRSTTGAGATIRVPMTEMVRDDLPSGWQVPASVTQALPAGASVCTFGILTMAGYDEGTKPYGILGGTFLRSAYVVYDLDHSSVSLAQSKSTSDDGAGKGEDNIQKITTTPTTASGSVTMTTTTRSVVSVGGGGGPLTTNTGVLTLTSTVVPEPSETNNNNSSNDNSDDSGQGAGARSWGDGPAVVMTMVACGFMGVGLFIL